MGKSNAERQAAWRERRDQAVERLRAELAEARAEIARLRDQLAKRQVPPRKAEQPDQRPRPASPKPARKQFPMFGINRVPASEKVKAMYRTLSKQHHPDAGGSKEAMAQLNLERDILLWRARCQETPHGEPKPEPPGWIKDAIGWRA